MKLINPSIGEVCDRLTILTLKILAGVKAGTDVSHFRKEQNALLLKVPSPNLNGAWLRRLLKLSAVNSALWNAEDSLRALRAQPPDQRAQWAGFRDTPWVNQVAAVAVRIQELNDERAELVRLINEAAGESTGAEKL